MSLLPTLVPMAIYVIALFVLGFQSRRRIRQAVATGFEAGYQKAMVDAAHSRPVVYSLN